jgi:mono/diheme cytochrome c family protein
VKRLRAGALLSASVAALTLASLLSAPAKAADGNDASVRGRALFETYCVLCHGAAGKGDGRAAALQKVRPSDLTASSRTDEYKLQIIANGGGSLSRSESMPAWKTVLSQQQIADVVAYLRAMIDHGVAHSAAEAHARAEQSSSSLGVKP